MPHQVIRQPQNLSGFVIRRIGRRHSLEVFGRLRVITLLVVSRAYLESQAFGTGIARLDSFEFGNRLIHFALLDELAGMGEIGCGTRRRGFGRSRLLGDADGGKSKQDSGRGQQAQHAAPRIHTQN